MDTYKQYLEANQNRPTRGTNRSNIPARANQHGDAVSVPLGKAAYALADEGSYFYAKNPTIGTGVAGIAAADGAEGLENLLYIKNSASDSDGTRIYLDYLSVVATAAGTNGTTTQFASWIDTGTERYTSGGSAITAVNCNMDSGTASVATVKFGALVTAAASSSVRAVGGGTIRTVIKVVGDRYTFDFGGYGTSLPGHAVAGTAIADLYIRHAPVVLGPGDMFLLEIFAASQTVAASFEFDLGWWER